MKKYFIHAITNYVSIYNVAAIIKAVGAYPIMADDFHESASITKNADALYINLGMLNEDKKIAMKNSIRVANEKGIPIVVDPVGIGASEYRREFFFEILKEIKSGVIKANLSEILSIYNDEKSHGVDNEHEMSEDEKTGVLQKLSKKYGIIFLMTGEANIAADGNEFVKVSGGSEMLKNIIGSGCMLGGIVAASVSKGLSLKSVKEALECSRDASLLAEKNKKCGPMEFLNEYIDSVHNNREE